MYEIVAQVSAPGCPPGGIVPTAISDQNVVVGYYFENCGFDAKPFMWTEETGFVAIPLPAGVSEARAMDVSNNGEVVGFMNPAGPIPDQPFHWKDGKWTELPLLTGFPIARAHAINDSGTIVGEAFDPNSTKPFRAVMWNRRVIAELRLPIGPNSYALDINDQSLAAGLMGEGLFGTSVGFLHDPQVTIEIPPLAGSDSSEAIAVNDQNVATGQSIISVKSGSVPRRSWVFQDGVVTDLGVLTEADHRTIAEDVSDARQIVGSSTGIQNGTSAAFLWQHGDIFNLETLIIDLLPDFNLDAARAINNNGWIAATGPMLVLRPVNRPPGDVNIDCTVDEFDLIAVLDDWGPDKLGHPTDMVTRETFQPPGDSHVDAADLAFVLGNWSTAGSRSLPVRR